MSNRNTNENTRTASDEKQSENKKLLEDEIASNSRIKNETMPEDAKNQDVLATEKVHGQVENYDIIRKKLQIDMEISAPSISNVETEADYRLLKDSTPIEGFESYQEKSKSKMVGKDNKCEAYDAIMENADAVLRRAIKEMRFDCSMDDNKYADVGDNQNSLGKCDDRNNILEEDQTMLDPTKDTGMTSRKTTLKRQTVCKSNSKSSENLAVDQDLSRRKIEEDKTVEIDAAKSTDKNKSDCLVPASENSDVCCIVNDTEKNTKRREASPRRWDSLENIKAKCERALIREGSSRTKVAEASSAEKNSKPKEKRTIGSLRISLEKKMESVERMLEDRMEKIWEENVEKHPWLQPIETWIVDHRKAGSHTVLQNHSFQADFEEQAHNEVEINKEIKRSHLVEPVFEFKYTAPEKEDEEPKLETKVTEIPKRSRRASSPRPEKSTFDAVNLISRLKRSDYSSSRNASTENSINSTTESEGVLEVKEVRHHNHDLFDKLKDNVKEKMEDIHRYFQRTNRLADVNRRLKSQIWSSVVTIVLVEAKNLLPMDIDGLSDPYVKFRLGTEKYKSKVVNKTLNPVWLEQFDLHLYEDPYLGQELEVTVWDRDRAHQDDIMGRTVIDLAALERETTHRLWRDLEDGSGNIFLLLTISGTTASETISDLAVHEETPLERVHLYQRYTVMNTLQRIRDVGHLTVKVYRAQGLAAADLGGKSDPFCVLELVNARLQTQTEYKTLAPNWQKIFTFNVKDINSVLEVTVYDEDRDHKVEFLGKVAIPLLRIRNGEKRWYALKDKKLRGRAKGNSPQILLEMKVVWNVFRACIRTLNPKEKKYMEPEIKFKRQVFLRNVLRLKAIIVIFIDIGKYMQSCWEWESKMRSIIALVFFVLGCYYFEPYMIPLAALLILFKYYLLCGDGGGLNQWISGQVAAITGAPLTHHATSHLMDPEGISDDCALTPGDDDDDDDDKDKEEKKSLKERLQAIQEVTQTVQNSIGYIASLCERVKNLFNFTVPYLSYLAMILAILGVAVLYFIPVRYLILAWGVNKFSRKILRPHSVPNNEVLDLVSRVPDDEELLNYRELKSLPTADCEKAGTSGSPGVSNPPRREQRKRHKAA